MKSKLKGVNRGGGRAVLFSIVFHALLFFIAAALVVVKVVVKPKSQFKAPPPKEKITMKLPQPVPRPPRQATPQVERITSASDKGGMPDVKAPEVEGMTLDIGDVGTILDVPTKDPKTTGIGNSISTGNDFVGTLYDLKRYKNGNVSDIDKVSFETFLASYFVKGWRESELDKYYRAPQKLFTSHFVMAPMPSALYPDFFGVPDMAAYWYFVKYEGKLVYPEDVRFRFWAVADAFGCVRVDGKDVLLTGKPGRLRVLNHWTTPSLRLSDRYYVGTDQLKVGDWIDLKANEPVDMKVLFGEWAGGNTSFILLVEVEGVEYPESKYGGPLLPVFKTNEITLEELEMIYRTLPDGECVLTNGPIFRDF